MLNFAATASDQIDASSSSHVNDSDAESSLSDWSDAEEDGNHRNANLAASKRSNSMLVRNNDVRASVITLSPFRGRRKVLPNDFYRSLKAATSLKGVEHLLVQPYWTQLQPNRCVEATVSQQQTSIVVSQKEVILECIWTLFGVPRSLFLLTDTNLVHSDLRNVTVNGLGIEVVRNILENVALMATYLLSMRHFTTRRTLLSHTHEALQGWLQHYLSNFDTWLWELCVETIFQLFCLLKSREREILLLYSVLNVTLIEEPESGICCEKACLLISRVLFALQRCLDPSERGLLTDLLIALMKPGCEIVDQWFRTGTLMDGRREFFVVPRRSSTEFKVLDCVCPLWDGLAEDIILAGKSVKFLHQCCKDIRSSEFYRQPFPLHDTWLTGIGMELPMSTIRLSREHRPLSYPCDYDLQSQSSSFSQRRLMNNAVGNVDILEKFQHAVRSRCLAMTSFLMQQLNITYHLTLRLNELGKVFTAFALQDFCISLFEQHDDGVYDAAALSAILLNSAQKQRFVETCWLVSINNTETLASSTVHSKCNFDFLSVWTRIDWPLNQVITDSHLESYNSSLRFILSLENARYLLTRLDLRKLNELDSFRVRGQLYDLRFSLLHFINTVLTGILGQVKSLFSGVTSIGVAQNVDMARESHSKLVNAVMTVCLQDSNLSLIARPVLRVADTCRKLRDVWYSTTSERDKQVADMRDDYMRCRKFILSILGVSKAANSSLACIHALLYTDDQL